MDRLFLRSYGPFVNLIHAPGREDTPGDCLGPQSVCGELISSSKKWFSSNVIKWLIDFLPKCPVILGGSIWHWVCSRNLRGRRLGWVLVAPLLVLRFQSIIFVQQVPSTKYIFAYFNICQHAPSKPSHIINFHRAMVPRNLWTSIQKRWVNISVCLPAVFETVLFIGIDTWRVY